MKKTFKIQKVPLDSLLEVLDRLWHEGAKFIDIDAVVSSSGDSIEVSARDGDFLSVSFFQKIGEYEELW